VGETSDPDSVRVGHVEREVVTQALVSHLVAGRLSLTEFEQRVQAAAEARTRGDLSTLFHDLPDPHGMAGTDNPGWARLPDALRKSLTEENLVALAEDLTGSITYRRYRVGGAKIRRREVSIVGAIAAGGVGRGKQTRRCPLHPSAVARLDDIGRTLSCAADLLPC
jgi:hypothetical protein